MPPKEKAKEQPPLDAQAQLVAALEGAKTDLELGQAMLVDKVKQKQASEAELLAHIERQQQRILKSTQDYVDILQHREEQIKAADARATSLQQQLERLQAEAAQAGRDIAALKEANAGMSSRLDDAAALLADRERLEETVKKQSVLIEQRGAEIRAAKAQVDSKDAALDKARAQVEELSLKCMASTQLHVLFSEPWLVSISRVRLSGAVPFDREHNTLIVSQGGKQLVLCGGHSRSHEGVGRELAVLSLDTLRWDAPDAAQQLPVAPLLGHVCVPFGRNKLLVHGGLSGDEASGAASVLSTDSMKWAPLQLAAGGASGAQPPPRLSHAAAVLRDRAYVFGGLTAEGRLLGDLWLLDLDSSVWTPLTATLGTPPSPRKGASLCATEDGRRLYLFGGNAGHGALNELFYLEVETLIWSVLHPPGPAPEPREGHVASVTSRFMFVTGGCNTSPPGPSPSPSPSSTAATAAAAATGPAPSSSTTSSTTVASQQRDEAAAASGTGGGAAAPASSAGRHTDTWVLDLFSGPAWARLDDGAFASGVPWLKQLSATSAVHGKQLYMLQPSLHERLDEMVVLSLTLPEDIERLKTAKQHDAEQVDKLELLDGAAATSSSLQISWRPPSKNSERITLYKLMLSTSTGVVREVYTGKSTKFTATRLRAGAEYIACVKASYDDTSALFSDSKAFSTRATG